jgi:hypothetical protein
MSQLAVEMAGSNELCGKVRTAFNVFHRQEVWIDFQCAEYVHQYIFENFPLILDCRNRTLLTDLARRDQCLSQTEARYSQLEAQSVITL